MSSYRTFSGHQDSVYCIAFSPDGQRLASASRDGTTIVWDVSSGQIQHRLSHQGRDKVFSVAFSPNGKLLAMCSEEGTVSVWHVDSWQNRLMVEAMRPERLVFSPDNSTVLVGCYKQVLCWDVGTSQLVRSLSIPSEICTSLHFSPDGKTLAAAAREGFVVFFDSETWTAKRTLRLIPPDSTGQVYRCVFSPDREICAASIQIFLDGPIGQAPNPNHYEILVWDLALEEKPDYSRSLVGHISWIPGLDFSPTGDLLASGSYDASVCLWDPHTHRLIAQFREHEGAVYSVAFSPDGELLATCSADSTVKLWRVAEIREAPKFPTKDPSVRIIGPFIETPLTSYIFVAHAPGWDGIAIAAQDVLAGLLSLVDSPKAVEDAVNRLFPRELQDLGSEADAVRIAVMFAIACRQEQAYREGDETTADFYFRLGSLITRIKSEQWEEFLDRWRLEGAKHTSEPAQGTSGKPPRRPFRHIFQSDPRNEAATELSVARDLFGLLLQVIAGELAPKEAEARGRALHPTFTDLLVVARTLLGEPVEAAQRGQAKPDAVAAAVQVLLHLAESTASPILGGQNILLLSLYNAIGICISLSGDNREGISWLERAVEQAKAIDNPAMRAEILGNLGNAYRNVGRLQDAQQAYKQAIAIAEEAASTSPIALQILRLNQLTNLSIVYRDLDDRQAEGETLRKAFAVAKMIGSDEQVSGIANKLGLFYQERGDTQGALEYYLEALALAERTGDDRERAGLLVNLGSAYHDLGKFDEALRSCTQGVEIAERIGLANVWANGLVRTGYLYMDMGDIATARRHFERAVEVSRKQQEPLPLLTALMALAKFHEQQSPNPQRELQLLQEAARVAEALREQVGRLDEGRDIHTRLSILYTRLIRLYIDEGHIAEAFICSERARAALLLRELHRRKLEESTTGDENKVSGYAAFSISTAVLFDHLKQLGPHTVLISYFVTTNLIYTFILRADDGRIRCVECPVEVEKLDRIREDFTREVSRHPEYGDLEETWLELSRYVLDPVLEHLQPGDVLFIVPHGPLHNLPLHALKAGESRLIERWPVAYLPAVSALPSLMDTSPGSPKEPVVVGIQFVEEARAIADLLGANHHLIGESLEKAAVLDSMKKGDVVHISAYGFASQHEPTRSGWLLQAEPALKNYLAVHERPGFALTEQDWIFMSRFREKADNEIISVTDLESLRLHAKMVSISTCESGFVQTGPAEDPIGVVRGLLVAGALTVVAALWLVDPVATQHLMVAYYRQLKQSTSGWSHKPQALRLAMLEVMREYPHPYYWAPFVLIGGATVGVANTQEE